MAECVEEKRGAFSSRMGFVMAAAASAVGLGNLWRFPWLASHYGGGIFVIVYIILAVTFGFSLMVAEIALGRKTGKSCVSAFGDLCKKYKWMGMVIALIPLLIVPYYCVIGGWVTKWFAESAVGNLGGLADSSFWWSYITGGEGGMLGPSIWFLVFAAMVMICVIVGVNKGIEKLSRILLPALLVMMVAITIYALVAVDGTLEGLSYFLKPDPSRFTGETFLRAVSQIFYSMSLAMGIMITYGSYMKKTDSIEKSARNISLIDTSVAILAGLMIIPASFAMMGEAGISTNGPGLMFVTLPQVFNQMPGGSIVAPVFYLLVIFAALTSAVSLLETVVSVVADEAKLKRRKSIVVSSFLLIVIGIIVVLGFGPLMVEVPHFDGDGASILGILDTMTNSILMPIAAILTCAFIGYVINVKTISDEVKEDGCEFKFEKPFEYMIKYICPICLAGILLLGVADMFDISLF